MTSFGFIILLPSHVITTKQVEKAIEVCVSLCMDQHVL